MIVISHIYKSERHVFNSFSPTTLKENRKGEKGEEERKKYDKILYDSDVFWYCKYIYNHIKKKRLKYIPK